MLPIRRAPFLSSARERAERIAGTAERGLGLIPHVEDKTPWWGLVIGNLLWIGLILAVVILGWHLGIWPIVGRLFAWLGVFIPKPTREVAEMDVKTIKSAQDGNRVIPEKQIRRIETMKMTDPKYRAAFAQEAKKEGLA